MSGYSLIQPSTPEWSSGKRVLYFAVKDMVCLPIISDICMMCNGVVDPDADEPFSFSRIEIDGHSTQWYALYHEECDEGTYWHECRVPSCKVRVRYNDEPTCYTHSANSGSSDSFYSARNAANREAMGWIEF